MAVAGVVGRQAEIDFLRHAQALRETLFEPFQIGRAGGHALLRIVGVVEAELAGGARHHLHQALGPGERHRVRIELALLVHLRHQQAPVKPVLQRVFLGQVVVG